MTATCLVLSVSVLRSTTGGLDGFALLRLVCRPPRRWITPFAFDSVRRLLVRSSPPSAVVCLVCVPT